MAPCSLTSRRSTPPPGLRVSAMLDRISSTDCRVRRVGACMKWTISPGDRSPASSRPLSLDWASPLSVKGTLPLCEAISPCRTQCTLTQDNAATPPGSCLLPGVLDQGERAGRGALYARELVEGGEEPDPRRQIPQVHEPLDERDVRPQDHQMHDKLVRRPAGPPGRRLLEEVATHGFRPLLGDPAGGRLRQAGRLLEVFVRPDVRLRPVRPQEQDVAGPDRLADRFQLLVRLLQIRHVQNPHRLRRREIEDDSVADHPLELDLIYGLPALDAVQRALDVRPRVQAHQLELRGLP